MAAAGPYDLLIDTARHRTDPTASYGSVLFHHPKILKCAVIGVPDETTGERVKAFVVLKPGESATAEEIIAWCRAPDQGLTGYRVPKEVEFRDELPETLIGDKSDFYLDHTIASWTRDGSLAAPA